MLLTCVGNSNPPYPQRHLHHMNKERETSSEQDIEKDSGIVDDAEIAD